MENEGMGDEKLTNERTLDLSDEIAIKSVLKTDMSSIFKRIDYERIPEIIDDLRGSINYAEKTLVKVTDGADEVIEVEPTVLGVKINVAPMKEHPVESMYPETCASVRGFFNECYELFLAKQQDRGPQNIAEFGREGIVLRICDKYARIKRIIWDNIVPEVSEPVENEYKDLAVYSAIDSSFSQNKWGK